MVVLVASGVALAILCVRGVYVRYNADDYWTASVVTRLGFWKSQTFWYERWSGRFAYTFLIGIVEAIGICAADGPHAVLLTLDHPRATLLTDLEIPILRADQAHGPPQSNGALDGLGPFTITGVAPGEVSLSPAATSVMATPHHAVVVRTVRDENARVQRLMSGRSDVAPNAISPQLLPALDGRWAPPVVKKA